MLLFLFLPLPHMPFPLSSFLSFFKLNSKTEFAYQEVCKFCLDYFHILDSDSPKTFFFYFQLSMPQLPSPVPREGRHQPQSQTYSPQMLFSMAGETPWTWLPFLLLSLPQIHYVLGLKPLQSFPFFLLSRSTEAFPCCLPVYVMLPASAMYI